MDRLISPRKPANEPTGTTNEPAESTFEPGWGANEPGICERTRGASLSQGGGSTD